MTTPSIEDGTTQNPIFPADYNSTTPISVQPIEPPALIKLCRTFGNEAQILSEYVITTLFENLYTLVQFYTFNLSFI